MNDMETDEEIAEPERRRFSFRPSKIGWLVVLLVVAGGLNLLVDADPEVLDELDVASSHGAEWPPKKSGSDGGLWKYH